MNTIQIRTASLSQAIGGLIFLFTSHAVSALTTLNVTISSDNNPGGIGDVGDLRYALNSMNQSLNTTPDDYAIVFAAPMTIQLNGILPIINNSANPVNITIGNPGSTSVVTIEGNSGAYSGFFIPAGNVTIQNMILQNMTARGGNGGNGISGGGGGMGAGGAIFAPQSFLNGANPAVTLLNVSINNCSAFGGNGGSYFGFALTGNEGGGGGGGFGGNGGSITATGSTGGAGGGGFGGDGGDVTLSTSDPLGGGGGGGGGLGSRATVGMLTNLGNGGADQSVGFNGNGYGLAITAGSGGGGNIGGNNAGGAGGGDAVGAFAFAGGGGGGSAGVNGTPAQGGTPPKPNAADHGASSAPQGAGAAPSGGNGGDGGGGGGGGVVITAASNGFDGQAANGGYAGGGGGGAGTGAYNIGYAVQGGSGGLGGGGGGGGVNQSGTTPAGGGNSLGGGGGAGAGPSNGVSAAGGADTGNLGGGAGGVGANTIGAGSGGGGGGGGSGLGGAIFVDSNLNFTLQALAGVLTTVDTSNDTTQAGTHGTGGTGGGADGLDGSALGNSIFLRAGSSLTFAAPNAGDLLTLGSQVAFTDDTAFGAGGTSVFVKGNGTVAYNGTTNYQGTVKVDNANFKVNGQIAQAPVFVCRNSTFSAQPGMLSGTGTLTGDIFVNTGTIAPDTGATLILGSLTLNPPSVVHTAVTGSGTSLVAVTGAATLAGTLEINLDATAANMTASYTILTSAGISNSFASVALTGATPTSYSVSYLPVGAPTFVQLNIVGPSTPVRLQSFEVD